MLKIALDVNAYIDPLSKAIFFFFFTNPLNYFDIFFHIDFFSQDDIHKPQLSKWKSSLSTYKYWDHL